jgi:hypothetical protein
MRHAVLLIWSPIYNRAGGDFFHEALRLFANRAPMIYDIRQPKIIHETLDKDMAS